MPDDGRVRQRMIPVIVLASTVLAGCTGREPQVVFGDAHTVSAQTGVGAAPVVAIARDGQRAVAWVSAPAGGEDGRMYVSVAEHAPVELQDPLGPIEAHGEAPPKLAWEADGTLHALYVVSKVVPGRRFPASALRHIRSDDGGQRWSAPHSVTDSTTFGSYNFHALHAAPDGTLYVAWLDGRSGTSAAFVATSTDGGRGWSANQRVASGEACPCCRTAIAADSSGRVWIAWRTVMEGGVRDIVVARSDDRGRTFAPPVRAHADDWVFDGCPHAGPALQVDGAGGVHLAWWTGKEGRAGVQYARSDDGGERWGAPIALGVAEFSRPAHVQLALAGERGVVAAWDDGTREVPQVIVRVSSDGGHSFGPEVPASEPGRAAGFPMLAVHGDRVTVLWSEQSPAAADHEAHARPNMADPSAVMGLKRVGSKEVVVREGVIR